MRLKAGRPDLADYTRYFDAPEADADAPLTVTWAGVTTLLVDDGSSALMTDGFFSRPGLATVGLGQIAPSASRIDGSLERLGVDRLEAVLPVHTHFDHAMDSAVVAQRTGARIVGGASAVQVGIGGGLTEDRLVVATPGEAITLGAYDVTLVEAEHCPPDRFPGVITAPVTPPVQDVGLQVRRGVVDARAPPAVGSSAAGHRQRGLRARRPCRIPRRGGVSRHRAAGCAARSATSSTTGPRRCGPSARAASC